MTHRFTRLQGYALLLVGAALCHACLAKEPEREAAPPATPAPPPPAQTPVTTPAEAPSTEMESEAAEPAPASNRFSQPPKAGAGGVAPSSRSAAPQPAKPKRSESAGPERDDLGEAADESRERKQGLSAPELLMQRLGAAVGLATPDCPSARDRKRAICDLAAQICRLVDNDPNVASVMEYCDDARKRCSEATERITQRCE